MKLINEYPWSHIGGKFFEMYYHNSVRAKSYVSHPTWPTKNTSYATTAASSWSNPPVAPPNDPLKYGTPQKDKGMGDEEWNPT